MSERPKLAPEALRNALRDRFGVSATALELLSIGNDAHSFVYRVEAGTSRSFFLKLRTADDFSESSLLVPRLLLERGVPYVVAPVPTLAGESWLELGGYTMSLHPFLDTRTAAEAGLADEQWRALGAIVRQVHEAEVPPHLGGIVPAEAFVPSRREVIEVLDALVETGSSRGDVIRDLVGFWAAHADRIRSLVERCDSLATRMRLERRRFVLCHADLHTWNVLLDPDGGMWIVDWDETVLAPRERDLMFVIGGIGRSLVSSHQTDCFLEGYGNVQVDGLALDYYRHAWAVQDVAAYGEQAALAPGVTERVRREALRHLMGLFNPGNIVDIATGQVD